MQNLSVAAPAPMFHPEPLTHLQRLEAESIHIMREVAAEAEHPVMHYSVGKDSAAMLQMAAKAFYSCRYNNADPYMPDLLVCIPELAGPLLAALQAR
jgi:3'-phosphoadenosine 5'-phosphosulfate sulfotransferase (PAPS reductase)/FAD synthetase